MQIFIWLKAILNLSSVGKNSEQIHRHCQGFLYVVLIKTQQIFILKNLEFPCKLLLLEYI